MENRVWIDGCFDFFHHGHANAILQAKQFGDELFVGVHSSEEITKNKGPPVMTLDERVRCIEANKWTTEVVPNAPYVTELAVMDKYGCKYCVHGDDVTTDSEGRDCYWKVREAERFKIVKRTEGVSTTDLIDRLLHPDEGHYIQDVDKHLHDNRSIVTKFATGVDGKTVETPVWIYKEDGGIKPFVLDSGIEGIYVEGAFDLFNPYHIEVLRKLHEEYEDKLIVGVYKDGVEYTCMDVLQRSLCVLQCKYVGGVIVGVGKALKIGGKQFRVDEFSNKFDYLKQGGISKRISSNLDVYLERQLQKGVKREVENTMNYSQQK